MCIETLASLRLFLPFPLVFSDIIALMIPQIRETVLTFIIEKGQHQKLLKTKHLKHLKQLIVSSGQPSQVKDLLDCLISQNWYVFSLWLSSFLIQMSPTTTKC